MKRKESRKPNRLGLTVGQLLLALLVLGGIAGYFLWGSNSEANAPKTEEPSQPITPKKSEDEQKTNSATKQPQEKTPVQTAKEREHQLRATIQTIEGVEKALQMFAIEHDAEYPQSLDLLLFPEMVGGVKQKPYLEKPPVDGWKQPIQYHPPKAEGQKPLIKSFGPDQKEGGGDDISNLDEKQE